MTDKMTYQEAVSYLNDCRENDDSYTKKEIIEIAEGHKRDDCGEWRI